MHEPTRHSTPSTQHLILASASPARLKLMEQAGFPPDKVLPADVDETPLKSERPEDYVLRVARKKADAIAALHPDAYIVAADTVACIGRNIIGKARDADHAREIIRNFSGRRHRVHTGLCVIAPGGRSRTRRVTTVVKFAFLSDQELDTYIASGEWQGKAGAFGIQGRGGSFIEWVNGSVSNVIGLPLTDARNLLKGLGYNR